MNNWKNFIGFLMLMGFYFTLQFSLKAGEITGTIVFQDDMKAAAFVSVISLDFDHEGAITSDEGKFSIDFKEDLDRYKLFISAANIKDTTVIIDSGTSPNLIKVDRKVYFLDEVKIVAKASNKIKKLHWHDSFNNLRVYGSGNPDDFKPSYFSVKGRGEYYGNAFKVKKSMHLLEVGFLAWTGKKLSDKLSIRLFFTDKDIKFARNNSYSDLKELILEPIIHTVNSRKFVNIDLRKYGLIIDEGYLIVAISPILEDGDDSSFPIVSIGNKDSSVSMMSSSKNRFTIFHPRLDAFYIGIKFLEQKKNIFQRLFGK